MYSNQIICVAKYLQSMAVKTRYNDNDSNYCESVCLPMHSCVCYNHGQLYKYFMKSERTFANGFNK